MNNKLMKNNPKKTIETKLPITLIQALDDLRDSFFHGSDSISYIGQALAMLGLLDASTKIDKALNDMEEKIDLLEHAYQNDLSGQVQSANEHSANMLNAALAGIKIAKGNTKHE